MPGVVSTERERRPTESTHGARKEEETCGQGYIRT